MPAVPSAGLTSSEKESKFFEKLTGIFEFLTNDPSRIMQFIYDNPNLLYEIIEKFIEYNMHIKEGRLQELDNNCSEYVKKIVKEIYRKNP